MAKRFVRVYACHQEISSLYFFFISPIRQSAITGEGGGDNVEIFKIYICPYRGIAIKSDSRLKYVCEPVGVGLSVLEARRCGFL